MLCWYPTPALAQDAGMTLPAFADFLYGSCLIDWKSMHKRISRHAQLLDEAEEVRIVGNETDLRLSVLGRRADVDAGTGNMPGGEFFVCPVETSAEGTIAFTEFPAMLGGREIRGIRLRFSEGRIVDASADSEEDFLIETLDTDEGARRIGELGIGCNPGIDRYMRNTYFDEKMNGTVHLALGSGFDLHRRHERVWRSTGTSSRTSVPAAVSSSTATSCRKTASGSPEPPERKGPD